MRSFLIIVVILIVLIGGAIFWLAGKANDTPPAPGEQRIEVELDV